MIILKRQDYLDIVEYAVQGCPNEVCGLLGGVILGDKKLIKKVYYLTNMDASREHFSMDPKEQLEAVKDMRKSGLKMIGNFHSHPESPSRPSEEDKRLAFDSKIRYLILSLMDINHPVLRAFIIENGNVSTEEIGLYE
jgi:proteasome lid subunit RPN8/RPN11